MKQTINQTQVFPINNSRINKTITFEGAGCADADSSKATDMTNCRVRTTFINDEGKKIYLELTGTIPSKYSPKSVQAFKFYGHVSHVFLTVDQKSNCSHDYFNYKKILEGFEYTKADVLKFLKKHCNASFESVVVDNDSSYSGFSHTGLESDDFHNDKPRQEPHLGFNTEQTACLAIYIENSKQHSLEIQKFVDAGIDKENLKNRLFEICRRNYQDVKKFMSWTSDNCSPEFPVDVVDMNELADYFLAKK
jgi:hypothetical protein